MKVEGPEIKSCSLKMDGSKVNGLQNGPFKNGRSRTIYKWTVHKVGVLLKTDWPVQGSNHRPLSCDHL